METRRQATAARMDPFAPSASTTDVHGQVFDRALWPTVSLLVAGIGIMNIMRVSVTERTCEIGIRMAAGPRTRDIRRQFLVEAATLTLIGGLAGVGLRVGGSTAIACVAEWATIVSPEAVVGAFVAAAATGLLFGFYPAWRASLLDPIEALPHA